MKILSNEDVARLLTMPVAIEGIDRVMRSVSAREVEMPLRHTVPVGGQNRLGVMSGAINSPQCYGVKLLSLFPENPARGLSGHRGAMVVFEPETGSPVAMMDAGLLTAIRTAAASAVATKALAREEAEVLTLIGTGEQAEHHLTAMCAVRPISNLRVVARDPAKAEKFANWAAAQHPELKISHGTDAKKAIQAADIICTVTNSATPVLNGEWMEAGQHFNIVGASIPTKREIDDDAVKRAALWVDYRPSALAQAGELVDMIAAGQLTEDHIRAEIGEVLTGQAPGRRNQTEITMYRSLGVIAQDLAVAQFLYEQATAGGLGTDVAF